MSKKNRKRSNVKKPTQQATKSVAKQQKRKGNALKVLVITLAVVAVVAAVCVGGWFIYDTFFAECKHEKVVDKAVAATCEETGLTEGVPAPIAEDEVEATAYVLKKQVDKVYREEEYDPITGALHLPIIPFDI